MPIKTLHAALERLLSGAQRHSTAVFAGAAAAAVVGGILVARLSFDANILRLLPRDAPTVRTFERFLLDFGSLDHLYVVFESPDAIGDHADMVSAYVDALRKAPEIESVDAALFEEGKDWTYLYDRELYLLGPSDAAEALGRLRPPALDRELAHARDLLSVPSADIKTFVQQDPLGLLTLLRNRMARQKGFVAFDPTQEGYVSPDGRSRLVIVKPRGAPFDTDFCQTLFRRLDAIEKTTRAAADEDASMVKIQAAGAYRVSLEAESLIRRESIVNSVGSMVLLLAIVIGVFRTPWMVLYGALPLALAAVLALGLAGVMLGRLSPATSGSAAMLFGLGIDGIALFYMRYLEESHAGAPTGETWRRMTGTAIGVLLAQITTAATFFALLFIDFPSLRDLGGLVGGGILISCVFTLVLLPALLATTARQRGRPLMAPWLGGFVARWSRAIVAAAVLVTLGLGLAAALGLRVNMSLERLQARTSGADLEREIGSRFGLPTDVLLVVNEGPAVDPLVNADARLAEALSSQQSTMSVGGISLLLPSVASQQLVADGIRRLPPLEDVTRDVRAGAVRAGFRPEAFQPFLARLPRLLDADARITYDGLIEHGLDPIVSRFITRRDGRYSAVTYLYPEQRTNLQALESAIHSVDPAFRLSGLPVIDQELERRFPVEFSKGILLGTVAVALLIYLVFRHVGLAAMALVPTAVGFIWSAGLLALARVELDLFSMFAAVTCIGIAVNYGIYVLHRYALDGSEDIPDALSRTGPAIMIACATAVVGFGTLINSSYGPLRTFGIVSVILLTCSLIASLVVLPAILIQVRR